MSMITIESGMLRAVVDVEDGAGIMAFYAKKGDTLLPIMPDARREGSDPARSAFLMIPYSNRIENGRFVFQGKEYRLDNAGSHAIHGDVRNRPWRVSQQSPTRIRCDFNSADHDGVNWPWPFEARAEYEVIEDVFSSRLRLWNRGETPMPAGFGWHPYFNRRLDETDGQVRLRMAVEGVYPDTDGDCIPSGPPATAAANQDFSTGRLLEPDNFLDICCHGYDGKGSIVWPGSGVRLNFNCSTECSHLVIYNPAGKPYFAVEPVTNANNGVNLLDRDEPTNGVAVLQPGERLEAEFDLRVEFT